MPQGTERGAGVPLLLSEGAGPGCCGWRQVSRRLGSGTGSLQMPRSSGVGGADSAARAAWRTLSPFSWPQAFRPDSKRKKQPGAS